MGAKRQDIVSSIEKKESVGGTIGRELYTAPFCFFPAAECAYVSGKCYDKFEVVAIEYDSKARKINAVDIANTKTGKVRTFTHKRVPEKKAAPKAKQEAPAAPTPAAPAPASAPATPSPKASIRTELVERCAAAGINPDWIAGKCGVNSFQELSDDAIRRCSKNWNQLVAIFKREMGEVA